MPATVHTATIAGRVALASDVFALDLRPHLNEGEGTLAFRAGQFISLRVGLDEDANPIQRSYSVASSPGAELLRLVVKRVPGGVGSDYLEGLAIGQEITFAGPMGFFVLELTHQGDVVFGATGVGIAPVLPMVDEALARSETGRVQLYWGNRVAEHLFWQAELAARRAAHPRFDYQLFLSGQGAPAEGTSAGRITQPILAALDGWRAPSFYLVGSGAMIKELKSGLVARGVDRKKQIHNEAFFD